MDEDDMRPKKYQKFNPVGENIYLRDDESLDIEEHKIIAVQRMWLERAYAPHTGRMYKKLRIKFYERAKLQ